MRTGIRGQFGIQYTFRKKFESNVIGLHKQERFWQFHIWEWGQQNREADAECHDSLNYPKIPLSRHTLSELSAKVVYWLIALRLTSQSYSYEGSRRVGLRYFCPPAEGFL